MTPNSEPQVGIEPTTAPYQDSLASTVSRPNRNRPTAFRFPASATSEGLFRGDPTRSASQRNAIAQQYANCGKVATELQFRLSPSQRSVLCGMRALVSDVRGPVS